MNKKKRPRGYVRDPVDNEAAEHDDHETEPTQEENNIDDDNQKCCWKCHGHGHKYSKTSRAYDGAICGVCQGKGKRLASTKAQWLADQPGQIIPLRGKNGIFIGPQAHYHGKLDALPPHLQLQKGELLAALGCGNWRIYQLAHGHKLTVDDFMCAYVAARELRSRFRLGPQDDGPFGRPGKESQDVIRHADVGCGCGSVLMTLAWAFPGKEFQSFGVEAQKVSFGLLTRGLEYNLGIDPSQPNKNKIHKVRIALQDLRTWDGGDLAPYDVITGTPPYFPQDRFIESPNASQKVECRVPTRGAATDYVQAAARLLAPHGVFIMVETARIEGAQAVLEAVSQCQLQVIRRLDVITRTGLPPRFSVWTIVRNHHNDGHNDRKNDNSTYPSSGTNANGKEDDRDSPLLSSKNNNKNDETDNISGDFEISTLTLRNQDQTRTLEYVNAMEIMGWVDFMRTKEKLEEASAAACSTTTTTTTTTTTFHTTDKEQGISDSSKEKT